MVGSRRSKTDQLASFLAALGCVFLCWCCIQTGFYGSWLVVGDRRLKRIFFSDTTRNSPRHDSHWPDIVQVPIGQPIIAVVKTKCSLGLFPGHMLILSWSKGQAVDPTCCA